MRNKRLYSYKPIYEGIEEDSWAIKKLESIISKTKKIPKKQRTHMLVSVATGLLTLYMIGNIDYWVRSIGDPEFSSAYETAKKISGSGDNLKYTILDIEDDTDYDTYANICQAWIDKQKNNHLGLTGQMFAKSARRSFRSFGNFLPPELALSQATIEGAFSEDTGVRPIRTRNPFNVGNVDTGGNKYFDDPQDAIDAYYNLMASSYLSPEVSVDDLLSNFVRMDNGQRYASSTDYEKMISKLMTKIKKYTQEIIK